MAIRIFILTAKTSPTFRVSVNTLFGKDLLKHDMGLFPIPCGPLLDVGSPTKALEYMALGLLVAGDDKPDKAAALRESGVGLCLELGTAAFADGVIGLLEDEALRKNMMGRGPDFINRKRNYQIIAGELQTIYKQLFNMADTECSVMN